MTPNIQRARSSLGAVIRKMPHAPGPAERSWRSPAESRQSAFSKRFRPARRRDPERAHSQEPRQQRRSPGECRQRTARGQGSQPLPQTALPRGIFRQFNISKHDVPQALQGNFVIGIISENALESPVGTVIDGVSKRSASSACKPANNKSAIRRDSLSGGADDR